MPFGIEFYIDDIDDSKLIYQVIIDNPDYELNNVKVLVIHNVKTNDIFPSVGIVVDKTVTINEDNKGIILMGYIDETNDIEFKVLVETNNNKYIYQYSY